MERNQGNRHLEVSAKLIEMGNALIKEGSLNEDYGIAQTGSFMVLIGGVLFNEDDVKLFGQLCGMFSAKKVLYSMDEIVKLNEDFNPKNKNVIESYDDFIKRMDGLRDGDNDDEENNNDKSKKKK